MKTRLARSVAPAFTVCLIILAPAPASAQPETIEADLPSVINGTGWKVFNRSVTLIDRKQGWIALWVDVAGGDFANLKITPAP